MARRLGRGKGGGGWTIDVATGAGTGSKGMVTVAVKGGKDGGTQTLRLRRRWREDGNDGGRSKVEIEEMDLEFTLPPPENPGHYYHHGDHHYHHHHHHYHHHYHRYPK